MNDFTKLLDMLDEVQEQLQVCARKDAGYSVLYEDAEYDIDEHKMIILRHLGY